MELIDYKKNVTSQFGEDGVIEKIFSIIDTERKRCMEFGAWDGKHLSNTWNLLNNKGWNGILIEADKEKFKLLEKQYESNKNVICINSKVDSKENNLDKILEYEEKDIDLLSIDVDGDEYHIWESIKEIKPRVVIIEFNPTIPAHIEYIGKRGNMMTGSSALALTNLGKRKGYELICCTGVNAIFVLRELYSKFDIVDNSVELLMSKKYLTYIMSEYNGKFVAQGNPFYINVYQ